jgi:hypothetical protein
MLVMESSSVMAMGCTGNLVYLQVYRLLHSLGCHADLKSQETRKLHHAQLSTQFAETAVAFRSNQPQPLRVSFAMAEGRLHYDATLHFTAQTL